MHIRERGISMANAHLRLVAPTGNIPTVRTPRRRTNAEYRSREHLTEREVERLIEATSSHRDATMILLAFRHGLRAAELVDLRWDQVNFETGVLHVRRPRRARQQRTRSLAANCERCAGCSGRQGRQRTCLCRSARPRSP